MGGVGVGVVSVGAAAGVVTLGYDESQVGGMFGGVVSATRRLVTGTVRRIDAHSLAMGIRHSCHRDDPYSCHIIKCEMSKNSSEC